MNTNISTLDIISKTYPTASYWSVAAAYTANGWEAGTTLAEAIERGATHLSLDIWNADWGMVARADFSVAELGLDDLKPSIPADLKY